MMDGRARKMGIGPLQTISLAEARKRAADARVKVHDGIDPIDDHKAKRAHKKLEAAKVKTFKECADLYVEARRGEWKNSKHADQWFSTFNATSRGSLKFPAATEAINGLHVAAIDTGLVLKVLEPIWTKTPESANRIRGRIEAVLDWAKVRELRDGENPARWRGHLDKILPKRQRAKAVKHHDALPYSDLAAFMAALRAKEGLSALALEFAILTAARTGEVIGARWPEIDVAASMWTVPGERTKSSREHRVPLSGRAIAILDGLSRDGDFVFPGGRKGKPLSNMALLELVRGMRGKGATVHGFRSTFRDWAAEQTSYSNELCEIALAHTVKDRTEAAYRRGDMMEKRRRLMRDWADYCGQSPIASSSDNVRPIRATAP
jgi:integrase